MGSKWGVWGSVGAARIWGVRGELGGGAEEGYGEYVGSGLAWVGARGVWRGLWGWG